MVSSQTDLGIGQVPSTLASYGDTTRYYAGESRQSGQRSAFPPEHALPPDYAGLVSQDAMETVSRAVQQWNIKIRDFLRNETGLRIPDGRSVSIRVVDGCPKSFIEALKAFTPLVWFLRRHEELFNSCRDGLDMFRSHLGVIGEQWPHLLIDSGDAENIIKINNLIKSTFDEVRQSDISARLRAINEDVLGAYFFRRGEIRIYWMPITIISGTLNVSSADLTAVVLAHELAHAYTHLGHDIDSSPWDTDQFAATDLDIVEGLAQFYTDALTQRLNDRTPGLRLAYERLLSVQSATYHAHEKWRERTSRAGEVIRFCMIDARVNAVKDEKSFNAKLVEVAKSVKALKGAEVQ